MYQGKVDVDMLNAVKILADVSSVSPSSEQRGANEELFALTKG